MRKRRLFYNLIIYVLVISLAPCTTLRQPTLASEISSPGELTSDDMLYLNESAEELAIDVIIDEPFYGLADYETAEQPEESEQYEEELDNNENQNAETEINSEDNILASPFSAEAQIAEYQILAIDNQNDLLQNMKSANGNTIYVTDMEINIELLFGNDVNVTIASATGEPVTLNAINPSNARRYAFNFEHCNVDITFDNVILQGDGRTVFMRFQNSNEVSRVIRGGTFKNGGNINGYGGAFFVEHGNIIVENCTFEGNTAAFRGGALYLGNNNQNAPAVAGDITIINCDFINNTSGEYGGGAISVQNDWGDPSKSKLTVTNSRFENNSTIGEGFNNGGAITGIGEITVENCFFSGNTAANGGAISASGNKNCTVRNCVIEHNHSTGSDGGGGIYSGSANLHIEGSRITNNTSDAGGGGIFGPYYSKEHEEEYPEYFSFSSEITFDITNSTISDNTAVSGGGIYATGATVKLMESSVISNNKADYGGGIFANGAAIQVINSEINGNTAKLGGGIYEAQIPTANSIVSSSVLLDDKVISNNEADYGGGIYAHDSSIELISGEIAGNTAEYDGGGIYMTGSAGNISEHFTRLTVANAVKFYNNKAAYSVGAPLSYHPDREVHESNIYIEEFSQDENAKPLMTAYNNYDVNYPPLEQSRTPLINNITDGDVTVTGEGVPGSVITVILPDGIKVDTTVDENGQWSIDTGGYILKEYDVVTAIQIEIDKYPSDNAEQITDPVSTPAEENGNLNPDENADQNVNPNPSDTTGQTTYPNPGGSTWQSTNPSQIIISAPITINENAAITLPLGVTAAAPDTQDIYLIQDEIETPLGFYTPVLTDNGSTEWIEVNEEGVPLGSLLNDVSESAQSNPKTGDTTYVIFLLALISGLSSIAVMYLVRKAQKENMRKENK